MSRTDHAAYLRMTGGELADAAREASAAETRRLHADLRSEGVTAPAPGSPEEQMAIENDWSLRSSVSWTVQFLDLAPRPEPGSPESRLFPSQLERDALAILAPADLQEFLVEQDAGTEARERAQRAEAPPESPMTRWDAFADIVLEATHLGGSPELVVGARGLQIRFTAMNALVFKDRRDEAPVEISFRDIKNLEVEAPDGPDSRVTAPRALGLGVLSLGLKKRVKNSYLVLETGVGEVIFEIRGYTAMELRGLLSPLQQHLITVS